ncbi:hypothetical protein ABZ876_28560 [Streptomyces sp. NPDC046931]
MTCVTETMPLRRMMRIAFRPAVFGDTGEDTGRGWTVPGRGRLDGTGGLG